MDDAWNDEHELSSSSEISREWRIRYERLFQQGFRDGVDRGMHEKMQEVFNHGFHDGILAGKRLGYVEGALKVTAVVSPEDAKAVCFGPLTTGRLCETNGGLA